MRGSRTLLMVCVVAVCACSSDDPAGDGASADGALDHAGTDHAGADHGAGADAGDASGDGAADSGGAPAFIIADHTVVAHYADIPQGYIDQVKQMLLSYPGESHGRGLLYGFQLLAAQEAKFAVQTKTTGAPDAVTDQYLRVHRPHWTGVSWAQSGGEEDTWTHDDAVTRINGHFDHCKNTLSNPVYAFAFGWCWDMTWQATCDANGWAGRIYTGFDKSSAAYVDHWDTSTTSTNLGHYLAAWQNYEQNNPDVAIIYSTGPVDGGGNDGCEGYQRWLKNEAIRDWVKAASGKTRYLFDYADILTHGAAGAASTKTWESHTFPFIHADYVGSYDGGDGGCHINEAGCLRLGKAMWWLLARIAGWPGT